MGTPGAEHIKPKKLKQSLTLNSPNKIVNKVKLPPAHVQRVAKVGSIGPGSGPVLGSENDKLYCICRAPHDEVVVSIDN